MCFPFFQETPSTGLKRPGCFGFGDITLNPISPKGPHVPHLFGQFNVL